MTPVPLDLPLRPPETAELASLIFDLAERKPLTDEIRTRIASRAVPLRLESIKPYFGSLSRDPVHHSTYYLAVDVPHSPPLLLHMAWAAAPTSSIFFQTLLIGRMRRATGPEIVINAIPFDSSDTANIEKFTASIDKSFVPRPHRSNAALVAPASYEAFEAYRTIWKRMRKNLATVTGPYHTAVWCAIRNGWREGYSAALELTAAGEASLEAAREAVRQYQHYSRFMIYGGAAHVERLSIAIRQARSAAKAPPAFDLGVAEPDEFAGTMQALKNAGHPAQLAAPRLDRTTLASCAEIARQFGCLLSVNAADHSEEDLQAISKATRGRFSCTLPPDYTRNMEALADTLFG